MTDIHVGFGVITKRVYQRHKELKTYLSPRREVRRSCWETCEQHVLLYCCSDSLEDLRHPLHMMFD